MKVVWAGIASFFLIPWLAAEEAGDPGDLVAIEATITRMNPDGTSSVVAEPSFVLALDTWGEVEGTSLMFVPEEWTNLSIPQELADSVAVDKPDDPSAQYATNASKLIVPPQPEKFAERTHGWTAKFRPRLLPSGEVEVDCRLEHTELVGFVTEENPVSFREKAANGGKEIALDANSRTVAEFATRETEITFSPTGDGYLAEIGSVKVSPESAGSASIPHMDVRLAAKRLEKRKVAGSSFRDPVVHLTTRFIEITEEEGQAIGHGDLLQPRVLSDPEFQVLVRSLNQKKGVDLLSAPSVVARPGQEAKIETVRDFIFPIAYSPPAIHDQTDPATEGFPVSPATPLAFETRQTGVSALLTPRLLSDGRIELTFEPRAEESDGFLNFAQPIHLLDVARPDERNRILATENRMDTPQFSRRRFKTTVRLGDGETLFFGGIVREDIQDVEDAIPVIGDLPLIGKFARNSKTLRLRRILYFAVKAQMMEKQ